MNIMKIIHVNISFSKTLFRKLNSVCPVCGIYNSSIYEVLYMSLILEWVAFVHARICIELIV